MLAGTPLPQMWVALVIQFPCACPEGAGPGLGGGGGAGSREGLWRGLKGPSGPTRLDAEVPWNNCGQRSGGPETGSGVKVPGWGSFKMQSPVRLGVLSDSHRKASHCLRPALVSLRGLPWRWVWRGLISHW